MSRSASTVVSAPAPRLPIPVLVALVGAVGFAAAVAANLDAKSRLVALGLIGIAVSIAVTRHRTALVLFLLIVDLQLPFFKTIGSLSPNISGGGAPSIYISTMDVLLIVLYGIWWGEGTMGADLRRLFSQRQVLLPFLILLSVLPSLLAAQDLVLWIGELVRIAAGLALYVYVAARIRSRQEVLVILAGLFAVALVQGLLVFWQWRSGLTGFELLGQATSFADRTTDTGFEIPRPSGTFDHPGFLGAVLGPVALLSLSLSITSRSRGLRVAAIAAFCAAVAAIGIAQVRATLLGLGVCMPFILYVQIRRGHFSWRVVSTVAGVLLLLGTLARDDLFDAIRNNVATEHLSTEVDVRGELIDVAMRIIADAPVFGVGLNNYGVVKERYEPAGVSLPILPVHNYFLLTWAETGLCGLLAGALVAAFVMYRAALVARLRDPLLSSIGLAIGCAVVFYAIEESFGFSVRNPAPFLIPWMLAGLSIAAYRIGASEQLGESRLSTAFRPVWPSLDGPGEPWPVPEAYSAAGSALKS